jgi:NAD(P)-dependent dehydrogenase (short-subunit alcohol dehydrogenase family)
MDLQLSGKRALVTGGSGAIGSVIAIELAREGVLVAVHGRDRERAERTADKARALGVKAVAVTGDLASDDGADSVADAALSAFGGIDILVNNAGGALRKDNPKWTDVSPNEWLKSYSVNTVAAIRLAQRLTPGMIERGWGRIINTSSIAGQLANGMIPDYGAAKAALDYLTIGLSKSLAPDGITVNAVVPGTIMTPNIERLVTSLREQRGWSDDLADNQRRYTEEFIPQPVKRLGRPEEIAAAVLFLASPLSGYTTGASIRVDGGAMSSR